jgi:CRP/FNR family cyclic AMP-dependent transcriptional regulator
MEKFELLQRSPLFDMLSPAELELAAEMSRPRRYAAGEVVFEEGDLGDSLFVVVEGEVDVLRRDDSGESCLIGTLGAPEFFGEMSLIDKEMRSATVRARTDCVLLQLTAENLAVFRRYHRDGFTFIVMNIARVLSSRLREADARLSAGG